MPVVDVESFRLRVVVDGKERAALSLDQLRTDYPSSDVVGKIFAPCCANLAPFVLEWCLPWVLCKHCHVTLAPSHNPVCGQPAQRAERREGAGLGLRGHQQCEMVGYWGIDPLFLLARTGVRLCDVLRQCGVTVWLLKTHTTERSTHDILSRRVYFFSLLSLSSLFFSILCKTFYSSIWAARGIGCSLADTARRRRKVSM